MREETSVVVPVLFVVEGLAVPADTRTALVLTIDANTRDVGATTDRARAVEGVVRDAGATVLLAERLWALVKQFKAAASKATRILITSLAGVVAS